MISFRRSEIVCNHVWRMFLRISCQEGGSSAGNTVARLWRADRGTPAAPICKTASAATLPPENAGRTSSALPRNAGGCAPERRHESWPGGMRFLRTAQQSLPLRRRVPLCPCCLCLLQRRSRRVGMDSWGRIRSFGAIWMRLDACLPVSRAFHAKTAARSFCLCPILEGPAGATPPVWSAWTRTSPGSAGTAGGRRKNSGCRTASFPGVCCSDMERRRKRCLPICLCAAAFPTRHDLAG